VSERSEGVVEEVVVGGVILRKVKGGEAGAVLCAKQFACSTGALHRHHVMRQNI